MVSSSYSSVAISDGSPSEQDKEEVQQPERDTRSSHTSVRKVVTQMWSVLVGTAVFAMPSTVYTTGWLLFVVTQLLFAALSAATSFYLLQTMQVNAMRPQTTAKDYDGSDGDAHRLDEEQEDAEESPSRRQQQKQQQQGHSGKGGTAKEDETTPLLSDRPTKPSAASSSSLSSAPNGPVRPLPKSSALLGLPHLCSHYGGRPLFYLYEVGVIIYLLFSLWGVAATFTGQASATVMALFFGEDCSMYNRATLGIASCQYAYYASLAVLIVLAVLWAVSGSPLNDRASDAAALFKLVGFVLMSVTVLLALSVGVGAESNESPQSHPHDRPTPIAGIGALGMLPSDGNMLKGVSLAVVYALLSYNISFDMASVFSPEQWQWWTGTGSGSKASAHSNDASPATRAALLVAIAILATLLVYFVIGILCAALFGARAATLINLHWRQYEGTDFLSTSATPSAMISLFTSIPLWARLLQLTILIFPCIAAIAALPYLADAQSESINRLLSYSSQHPHSTFILYRSSPPQLPGGKTSVALLSVLPPLLLTGVVGDLGEIFLWTAPLALFIQYVLPSVLLLLTRYGPNAEPQYGQNESDRPRVWYLRPSLLILLLVISSVVSLATAVLLCLYPLW